MTLQASGGISFSNILAERGSYGNNLNKYHSQKWWNYTNDPATQIKYDSNIRLFFSGTYSPSYGNNPSDKSGWPYAAWGYDIQYSGSSGVAYYPFIAPGGMTYFTFGCDNYGGLAYATSTQDGSTIIDPTTLTYTTKVSDCGFPGYTNYLPLAEFEAGTLVWIKIDFRDVGRVFAYTFTISINQSSEGIIITSRTLDGNPGKPYCYKQPTSGNGTFGGTSLKFSDFYGKRFTPMIPLPTDQDIALPDTYPFGACAGAGWAGAVLKIRSTGDSKFTCRTRWNDYSAQTVNDNATVFTISDFYDSTTGLPKGFVKTFIPGGWGRDTTSWKFTVLWNGSFWLLEIKADCKGGGRSWNHTVFANKKLNSYVSP